MSPKNKLLSTYGYSLIELVGALAVVAISALIISTIISNSTAQFSRIQKTLSVQQQFITIESALKKAFRQAVNLRLCAGVVPATQANGCIRAYDSVSAGTALTTLAVFARETGSRPNQLAGIAHTATPVSRYRATGIFFQPPTGTSAPFRSGVLFIDSGSTTATAFVSPDYSDLFIPGLVSMRIASIDAGTLGVKSAQVTVVLREFLPTQNSLQVKSWCQPLSCPANMNPYKDITHVFTILFRNNIVNNDLLNPGIQLRTLGRLYFFDMKENN